MKTMKKILLSIAFFAAMPGINQAQVNNEFLGFGAGNSNTGNNNTFLGDYSGYNNTSGYYNTFVGNNSGYANTTGMHNTFLGKSAGYYNTTGSYNIFSGYVAGYANTTGSFNTFSGQASGYSNTTGNGNTFSGYKSGYANTTGSYNTFVGHYSGFSNTIGNYNTFVGKGAGYYNTTGSYNIFSGYSAGHANTTGSYNTFSGYESGQSNTTGSSNSFSGHSSGRYNTTGSYNTFSGRYSGSANTTGNNNMFAGYQSGYWNTSGSNNSFYGDSAGIQNSTGSSNLCIGFKANLQFNNLTNASAIGANAVVGASNALVLGNNANVGIGTSAPAYKLQLSTDGAAKPGSSTWTIASDKRLKKDVSNFTDGLSVLEKIQPVWFSYNGEAGMPVDKKFVGIIAQEMKEIAPYTVGTFHSQDENGNITEYLDYDANALFYILVNSVKEQQISLTEKDAAIAALNARVERLEQLIENNLNTGNPATSSIQDISECCDASLEQNYPNPFNESTTIKYYLDGSMLTAVLVITNIMGVEVQRYSLSERGNAQITIPANTLAAGSYYFQLIIDGKQADVKMMEIVK